MTAKAPGEYIEHIGDYHAGPPTVYFAVAVPAGIADRFAEDVDGNWPGCEIKQVVLDEQTLADVERLAHWDKPPVTGNRTLVPPCTRCTGQNGVHYLTCPVVALPSGMTLAQALRRTEAQDAADWYQAT